MDRIVRSSADTFRLTSCCAALAAALALSGCGGIAAVGSTVASTVASGAEAVGTLFKKSVNEEDEKENKDEAAPK